MVTKEEPQASEPKKNLKLMNFVKGGVMVLPKTPVTNLPASAKDCVKNSFEKDERLAKSGEELMARFMQLVLGDIERTEPPVILVFQLKVRTTQVSNQRFEI